MANPYRQPLINLFETINYFKHTSIRLDKVLRADIEKYKEEGSKFSALTALIIGDWTGPTDNGRKINFHSGILNVTTRERYPIVIENLLSIEFGLAYAQCYESFERNHYCPIKI